MDEVEGEEELCLESERGKGKGCAPGVFVFFVCTYKHDAPAHPANPALWYGGKLPNIEVSRFPVSISYEEEDTCSLFPVSISSSASLFDRAREQEYLREDMVSDGSIAKMDDSMRKSSASSSAYSSLTLHG